MGSHLNVYFRKETFGRKLWIVDSFIIQFSLFVVRDKNVQQQGSAGYNE